MRELERREVLADGYNYLFDIRPDTGYDPTVSDNVVIDEEFNEDVYQVTGMFGDTGNVMDLGGNIGAFDIYAIYRGAQKIFSFEPEDENYECLTNNIAINSLTDKIIPIKLGVSDKKGTQSLYVGQGASFVADLKTIPHQVKAKLPIQTIKMITLEDAVKMVGVNEFDVLKVDVEGSEYRIFQTPKEIMQKFRYITIEFHPTTKEFFGDFIAKLTETHNVHIIGKWNEGGNIYATRY